MDSFINIPYCCRYACFGLWSVRDFCHMLLVEYCHALFCYVEHCYLMLFSAMSSNFTKSVNLISFALCDACLNLLCCDLAIAQCSCFVKHLEYITFICFFVMLKCSSLTSWCMLSGIMLLIAELCHSCFACHWQTVHPFAVIFIYISTEIISSFQWHPWFAKLLPCSSFSFRSTHMHRISYLA